MCGKIAANQIQCGARGKRGAGDQRLRCRPLRRVPNCIGRPCSGGIVLGLLWFTLPGAHPKLVTVAGEHFPLLLSSTPATFCQSRVESRLAPRVLRDLGRCFSLHCTTFNSFLVCSVQGKKKLFWRVCDERQIIGKAFREVPLFCCGVKETLFFSGHCKLEMN